MDDDPIEELYYTMTGLGRRSGRKSRKGARQSGTRSSSFAQAGPKLKELRERSGWTVSEIAERTGVRLAALRAFEKGDPAAAEELAPDLDRLASACCGTVADLLGSESPWRPRRSLARRSGFDPYG